MKLHIWNFFEVYFKIFIQFVNCRPINYIPSITAKHYVIQGLQNYLKECRTHILIKEMGILLIENIIQKLSENWQLK